MRWLYNILHRKCVKCPHCGQRHTMNSDIKISSHGEQYVNCECHNPECRYVFVEYIKVKK